MGLEVYWDKFLDFFGLKDKSPDYDEQLINEVDDKKGKKANKIVSLHRNQELRVKIYHPDSFNEVETIVDSLKTRRPVILNVESLDRELARRCIDFMSGAVYGLNGSIQKVGTGVFLFTPSNIEIDGSKIEGNLKDSFLTK